MGAALSLVGAIIAVIGVVLGIGIALPILSGSGFDWKFLMSPLLLAGGIGLIWVGNRLQGWNMFRQQKP
jgi:hypothetical protein